MTKTSYRWLVLLMVVQPISARVTLAPLFQDHAVLQRDKPVPVWGHAEAGKRVTVTFAGQKKSTITDPAGRWQVTLDALHTSVQGRILTASEVDAPPVEVKDLLVGEVWIGSGQSNMQFAVNQTCEGDQEMAAAAVPLLRLFDVPRVLDNVRQETVDSKWLPATLETAKGFSAVAYFFGKKLTEELKVPVGMIHSSWGGSRIEPWWAEEGLEGIEDFARLRATRLSKSPGFPEYDRSYRRYVTAVGEWSKLADKALDAGKPAPEMPTEPQKLKLGHTEEAGTYQAMIHPLVPFALQGFIWYQGESNNGEGMLYTTKMQALIAGWRKQFRAADAPFLFVQLAPYHYGDNRNSDLPGIWRAQQEALKIPHTGMAVINDIGNVKDIHPDQKSEVARRLALWALADTYGKEDIVKSGPLFSAYRVTRSGIEIHFDHTGGGLVTRDGKSPTLFEIAGIDGEWQPANAEISSDAKTLMLSAQAVSHPDRARFAWSQIAEPNLTNKERLPAAAFNTHWPSDPTLGRKVSGGKPILSSHPNSHGWDGGLTDGVWGSSSPGCYATDESETFPKFVTVDLGKAQTIHLINYGTPDIGATKTVAISISEDGKTFSEVGRDEFPAKTAFGATDRFEPTKARFVRATFIDQHPAQDVYGTNFAFLSELEVYAP